VVSLPEVYSEPGSIPVLTEALLSLTEAVYTDADEGSEETVTTLSASESIAEFNAITPHTIADTRNLSHILFITLTPYSQDISLILKSRGHPISLWKPHMNADPYAHYIPKGICKCYDYSTFFNQIRKLHIDLLYKRIFRLYMTFRCRSDRLHSAGRRRHK
jgi:hypothetical protein